jgi:hypothetical protein
MGATLRGADVAMMEAGACGMAITRPRSCVSRLARDGRVAIKRAVHVFGNGGVGDMVAQESQFRLDARTASEGVIFAHWAAAFSLTSFGF